jgi:hypothetical protein
MCLASILITPGQWFYLFLAASLLLLIGGLGIISKIASHVVAIRNIDIPKYCAPWPIPDRLFLEWKTFQILGRMILKSKWLNRHAVETAIAFGFLTGAPCGYMTRDVQQYMRLRTTTIHVLQDLGRHQYIVACDDPRGCRLEVCPGPDPGFDAGDWVKVTWEEQDNGHGGRCMSFVDQEKTRWRAIPGHAKNREVTNAELHSSN